MLELHNINKPKICGTTADNNRKYFFMKRSCYLSDEIDQLAILHQEVTTCTILINRIFSVQLMFFMAYEICLFVSKLFIIYIIFEWDLKRLRTSEFNYVILWYNVVVFVVAFWTTAVICHSCHATMKEVRYYRVNSKCIPITQYGFLSSQRRPETSYFLFF